MFKALLTLISSVLTIDLNAQQRKAEHDFLAKSVDLADLERRQRHLMNSNFKGWV